MIDTYELSRSKLKAEIVRWMRKELAEDLGYFLDASNCPCFTQLAEAWAVENDVGELDEDHPVWDAAILAFEPYRGQVNE